MELTPELLICITAFLKLANTIALCVLVYVRRRTTKR